MAFNKNKQVIDLDHKSIGDGLFDYLLTKDTHEIRNLNFCTGEDI